MPLTANQTHYLRHVLRLEPGAHLRLFNGRDGEWLADLAQSGKKEGAARCLEQLRPQLASADIWALFAPVKKEGTELMVEKATELGAAVLQPVLTARSNTQRVNAERWQAQTIEAAEQCERLTLPEIRPLVRLSDILANWPAGRVLLVCAERGEARPAVQALPLVAGKPLAVLTGPEGGFTPDELQGLGGLPFVVKISLGGNILRAETALIAALAAAALFSEI